MSSRRWFFAVVALSATLHVVGMARTPLPAQDGLKFLKVARQFQTQPWVGVVRSSDQHPLYSAFVAAAEPVVSLVVAAKPDAWRIAAQGVSALAALALLWPAPPDDDPTLRRADREPRGFLLRPCCHSPPRSGTIRSPTALALSFTVAALCLGESTLRTNSWISAVGCGTLAGLGFWTRPEVALVPPVVAIAAAWRWRSLAAELAVFGPAAGDVRVDPRVRRGLRDGQGRAVGEALAQVVDPDRHGCSRGPQAAAIAAEGARRPPLRLLAQGGVGPAQPGSACRWRRRSNWLESGAKGSRSCCYPSYSGDSSAPGRSKDRSTAEG